jgi:hypothetical protein
VCIVKRVLAILALVGVLSAGGAALLWRSAGGVGGSNVEQWVGNQLVGVLANYITPTIRFRTLDYQAPYTVVVSDLTIDHDDTAMVRLEQLRLELAEVPRRGEPIQIKEIVATRPRLLFRHAARGFVGWSGFVKPQAVTNPETIPEGQRFSDVLVLRRVQVSDGVLVYEERGRGDTRMTLPGVNLTLATPPIEGQEGCYALNCEVKRDSLFDARIDAQLNVDTQILKIAELVATITLDDTGRGALPPALQRLLERYAARGVLTARVVGEIPLASLDQATASVHAELADGHIALGQTAVPIGKIVIDGELPNGPLKLETGRVALQYQNEAIFAFDRFALTLAGLPQANNPWTITSLQLDRPTVALLRTDTGAWFGWSDIAPHAGVGNPNHTACTRRAIIDRPHRWIRHEPRRDHGRPGDRCGCALASRSHSRSDDLGQDRHRIQWQHSTRQSADGEWGGLARRTPGIDPPGVEGVADRSARHPGQPRAWRGAYRLHGPGAVR